MNRINPSRLKHPILAACMLTIIFLIGATGCEQGRYQPAQQRPPLESSTLPKKDDNGAVTAPQLDGAGTKMVWDTTSKDPFYSPRSNARQPEIVYQPSNGTLPARNGASNGTLPMRGGGTLPLRGIRGGLAGTLPMRGGLRGSLPMRQGTVGSTLPRRLPDHLLPRRTPNISPGTLPRRNTFPPALAPLNSTLPRR